MEQIRISSSFIWRRVHSLMGFWLVIYLFEHLLINSQAALWLGNEGSGFIRMVNSLESLPYLRVVEMLLIGVPLAVHMVWGVHRALLARNNSKKTSGSEPSLPYARNRAFTWQRLSSWILLIGILGHVAQMRFLDQPQAVDRSGEERFMTPVTWTPQLMALADRLHVESVMELHGPGMAFCPDIGTAMLFMVWETFRNPWMQVAYTLFVCAAAFHAFNGFWTFLITWGVLISFRSQRAFLPLAWIGMALLTFFGWSAIWGSGWSL